VSIEVRVAVADDAPGIRSLFARVFGAEMSAEEWDWKFALNPDGWLGTVAVRDGEIVGNYAGWAMRFHLEGEERLLYSVGDVAISAITAAELLYGAVLKASEQRAVERALASIAIAPFDLRAARVYGEVRSALRRRGTPIGPLDTLIAAHAIALGIPLVTNNVREFARVPGLRVENWLR